MRKTLRFTLMFIPSIFFSILILAQSIIVTGKVTNQVSLEGVPAVSVIVKGGTQGAFTDENGNFRITVPRLPVVLVFSSIGFEAREVTAESTSPLEVTINPVSTLGQEVIVAAVRAPERILESPVTVERMSGATLRSIAAPSYYEAISNMKGVDMHTASLTFRTVTTRGFISSGNNRLNQLIDGMDNQAPGLNFSVGSVIGLTELDVDNIELLAGASSALYGSGGMNGTLLINSKNPFKYQGLSLQVKQGINHIDDRQVDPKPYYDWSVRWAKVIKERFAFKIASQLVKAYDWQAYDYDNALRTGVTPKAVPGSRQTDPNYDGVNMYGDETSANMQSVAQSVIITAINNIIPNLPPGIPGLPKPPIFSYQDALTVINHPAVGATVRGILQSNPQTAPFFLGLNNNLIPNQNVSRTGYEERHLVDYNTLNYKITGGVHYKITSDIEASWNSYLGTGTTVYTGIERYSLKNLKMAQHKLEVRATNWFVRGYTTQENAGDSYANTVLGRLINEAWKPSQQWYPEYVAAFVKARSPVSQGGFGAGDYAAHLAARNFADSGRALPGTTQFNQYKQSISGIPIPRGARFLDKTDLWAGEAQVNLSDVLNFSEMFDVITGAQWKQYVLNSQGTIFADTAGRIRIAETGGYVQVRKKLLNELLTLTAAARYDKHTNFKGRFTPRLTAVVRVAPENYFRVSYQTGYRFPTNQDQYINLNSSANTYLIGFLRRFFEAYNLYNNPGYTPESVAQFRATGNESVLQKALLNDVKPESVSSFEVGYKGVMTKKVFLDAYTYYSHYTNFLAGVGAFQSLTGSAPGLLNPATTRQFGYIQNSNQNVKAYGWGVTIEYQLPMRFIIYGNVYSDKLVIDSGNGNNVVSSKEREVQFPGIFFNTPDYRFNLGVRNENVYRNIGFNVIYKWQSENYYEGTFISGTLPSFGWLDAQVTYKVPKSKSMVRIGGTNILNNYQRTAYGNPYVGGLYYVSYGYNIF